MFAQTSLLAVTTVIGAATAQLPAVARRDFVEARQFDGPDLDPACESALGAVQTLYSSLPVVPDELLTVTLPTDPCETPKLTGTARSAWSTYTSEALAWYTSHSDEFLNFVTACSDVLGGSFATDLPSCDGSGGSSGAATATTTTEPPTITTPVRTTSSSSDESSSSPLTTPDTTKSGPVSSDGASTPAPSPSSTVSTHNAAPRETGFVVVAAVAAAGLMGVVAAL